MRWHIWVLAGMAGLMAVAGTVRAQTDPKTVVATVNGHTITLGEVNTVLAAHHVDPNSLPPDKVNQARFEAASMLADGHLWEDYLKKYGPRIDSAVVNQHMADLNSWLKKQNKTWADYLKDTGQTEATVRAGITSILQWEALAEGKVGPDGLKKYYDQYKDFFDGVKVSASYILLRVPANATEADREAARQKLRAIRANVVAGTIDFAEAARRYSQDPTAADGGGLGTFPRKMAMPESIARPAFALPVKGISDVVPCDFGVCLILVTDRKPPERQSEYEKVKDEVRDICYGELQLAVMQQLRKEAKIKITLPK